MTVNEIYRVLCSIAPFETQMSFDNSGFQAGHLNAEVHNCLLALDVTSDVIDEAIDCGANLIITHHPLLFDRLRSLSCFTAEGKLALKVAEAGISVISMHTNLDLACGGVNDVLIRLFPTDNIMPLDHDGLGRIGTLKSTMTANDFLKLVKSVLHVNMLRYVTSGENIRKIAVVGGSGGEYFQLAKEQGCDALITADIKYHQFLQAKEIGITLIDADHYCTEAPVMQYLQQVLREAFPAENDIFRLSNRHRQIISCY